MTKIKEIEDKIKAITGSDIDGFDEWRDDTEKKEAVKILLRERQHQLNEIFIADERSLSHFKAINNRLYSLTCQLLKRTKAALKVLPSVMTDTDFDDDYNLEGTLRFTFNGEESVLKLEDDSRYGSDFTLMIKLISDISHGHHEENIEELYPHSELLDDGVSWNEYPFRGRKEFEDVIICHAVHQLTDHQLYSIPDLLRLNDFWAEVNLTIQSITDQKGNHWKPNN